MKEVSPTFDEDGSIIIPFTSEKRYHYWDKGQPLRETYRELLFFKTTNYKKGQQILDFDLKNNYDSVSYNNSRRIT